LKSGQPARSVFWVNASYATVTWGIEPGLRRFHCAASLIRIKTEGL